MTARAKKARAPLRVKRVYESPAASDGRRILVDRLWPRGLTKQAARVDHWARAISPSNALRKWYAHDVAKWDEFRRRYFAELDANADGVAALRELLGVPATLLFGSRELRRNNAVALAGYLASRRPRAKPQRSGAGPSARRGVRWEQVKAFVLAFPGTSEGTSYGEHAFLLDGKFFSRFNAKEQALVVYAEEALRDALLAGKPDVYFTTDHYRGYPMLLVRLTHVSRAELAALLEAAFRYRAKPKRLAEWGARRAARGTKDRP